MKAIEMATSHLRRLIDENKTIPVKEWVDENNKPLEIYYAPLSLWERDKVEEKSNESELRMAVHVVIMKAKDKNGNPLFTEDDFDTLYRGAESQVVAKIAKTILGTQREPEPIIKDMEKN